jgi:transposase
LLWVGKERTIESFQGFFTAMGEEITSKIVFICSDMWEPYLKVIREKCSDALHILDRFHIVAKMNKALDEVRAGESRRMASEGRTPLLKKSRWLLLKREENLKTEQRFRLRDLLRYNLKTVRAYLLKEAFQQLWEYSSSYWAGKFLDEWCRQTMRSRIEPMKKIARSLRPAPGADSQLLQGAKADFQRRCRGPEQQSQSHHEKVLRLSHLPGTRTGPLSLTWQAA